MWNCLWGNALKRSPGSIRKSKVSYPVPGFLSSATWPSLPKKLYYGLNQRLQIKLCPEGSSLLHHNESFTMNSVDTQESLSGFMQKTRQNSRTLQH